MNFTPNQNYNVIKGLQIFINDIRECTTKEAEAQRVDKELETQIPTFNDIYGLTGTSYEIMALCISVVEQLENQESLENMDKKISNLDNDISNKIKDQTDFHKKLDNELENQVNVEASIDNNNEISNENLINNDEININ